MSPCLRPATRCAPGLVVVAAAIGLVACPSATPAPPAPPVPTTTTSAPAAAPPVRRYVAEPTVPVTSPRGALAGRLPGGAVVQVIVDGARATLVGARLEGTVPAAALSETPVDAATFLPRLQAALRARDPERARAIAEAMLALDPAHPAALEVLGALLTTSDWRRSRALLSRRGPRTTATLPDPPPVGVGPAFVVASSLKLRASAAPEGRLVKDLPIGSAVTVDEVRGEWARVRVAPVVGETIVLPRALLTAADRAPSSTSSPVTSATDDGGLTGFVAARFLAATAPDAAALVALADSADDAPQRSAWLQRAVALSPCDVAVRTRAIDAAIDAGLFVEAAWNSRAPSCAVDDQRPAVALAGCRGRPEAAVVVDFGAPLPAPGVAPDLCVAAFERTTCFPAGDARGEAIEAARALEQLMDTLGMAWDAEPEGPRADEVRERRKAVKALWDHFEAEDARLTRAFADSVAAVDAAVGVTPWLDARLPTSPTPWLVVQEASVHPDTGLVTGATRTFRLPALATVTPGATVRAFVPLPTSTNAFVGVVDAADAATAAAVLRAAPVPGHGGADRAEAPATGRLLAGALLPLEIDCDAQACWH